MVLGNIILCLSIEIPEYIVQMFASSLPMLSHDTKGNVRYFAQQDVNAPLTYSHSIEEIMLRVRCDRHQDPKGNAAVFKSL